MRRATAFAIALTLSGGLAALLVDEQPVLREQASIRHETLVVRVEPAGASAATLLRLPSTTTSTSTSTTTVPEPTTTTSPEPETTTTTTEPELCPGLRHPAHHQPCPPPTAAPARTTRTTATPPVAAAPARGAASGDLLDALADCESDITASLDTGNGYYGAFQWLPRTWWGLTRPGQPWKDSYEAEMIAEILATSYSGQKAVAARIPLSSWPGQFPGCSAKLGIR